MHILYTSKYQNNLYGNDELSEETHHNKRQPLPQKLIAKDEMWDIINPARAQTIAARKQKSEILTPSQKEAFILPQITSATVRGHPAEKEETKDLLESAEQQSSYNTRTPKKDWDPTTSNRIRELEILVFDTRGQLEKKLRQLMEEFPSKLQRELTAIQNRDQGMWKSIESKTAGLYESLAIVKDSYKSLSSSLNEKLNTLQRKSDEAELRLISLEKSLERTSNANSAKKPVTPIEAANEKLATVQFQMELSSLKEQLQEDRRKRDGQIDELFRNLSEMDNKWRSQINSLSQNLQRLNETPKTPEHVPQPPAKFSKGELEYMGSQIYTLDKKVNEEMAKRIKMEEDLLKYLDEKVLSVKEKMKQEEKGSLEREKKMLGNIQEGLVTINDILKGTNEENALKLTKVETELTHHLESLTQHVESTTKALGSDLGRQGEDLKSLSQKLAELEETSTLNLQNVSSSLQEEIARLGSKVAESHKALIERQEDVFSELHRQEKLLSATKDELLTELAVTNKSTSHEFSLLKEKLEAAHKYIRERTVMLKFELDEAKKELDSRCALNEKTTAGDVRDLDKRISKKVDDFTIFIDDTLRSHTTKTNEALTKQTQTIEANKKSLDEHIKQQANSIKALSRAFTEKEAAERKEAVDELGLRFAKKLSQMESDTNNKILNMEVEVRNYAERKVKMMEEEIMLDVQPKLVMEKIVTALENEERKQQMEFLWDTLNHHMEKYSREMQEVCESFVKVNENLKKEITTRASAVNGLKEDIEVKDVVNRILDAVADEENKNNLEENSNLIREELKNESDKLTERINELEVEVKDEVMWSTVGRIATDAAINAVEYEIGEMKVKSAINEKETQNKIEELEAEISEEVANSLGNKIASDAALNAMEYELLELKGQTDQNMKELNTRIQEESVKLTDEIKKVNAEIEDEVCKSIGNQTATQAALNALECEMQRTNEQSKKETESKIKEEAEKLTNWLQEINLEVKDEVAKSTGYQIAVEASLSSIESRLVSTQRAVQEIDSDINNAINKTKEEIVGIIHNVTDSLNQSVSATTAEQIANKVAMDNIERRMDSEVEGMRAKVVLVHTEVINMLNSKTAQINELAQAQENKLNELSGKLNETTKLVEDVGKQGEEIKDQLAAEISNLAKGQDEKSVALEKKLEESHNSVVKVLDDVSGLQEQMNQKIETTLEKVDALEKIEPKLVQVVEDSRKLKEETMQKLQEVLGTMNNEVESVNKRIEIDLSQARIDIEKKTEGNLKALESRIKALEVDNHKEPQSLSLTIIITCWLQLMI
eukprot:TRINITY_DN218_c0_g1_i1.p1 TRINITY_DN218_c0_g1~~TRINITY_DN218_c0_g1_i1.p1  ORF type:complete len:1293 (-),score=260.81 TRINITY_DN218_c0_g1_i1:39-3917(-)